MAQQELGRQPPGQESHRWPPAAPGRAHATRRSPTLLLLPDLEPASRQPRRAPGARTMGTGPRSARPREPRRTPLLLFGCLQRHFPDGDLSSSVGACNNSAPLLPGATSQALELRPKPPPSSAPSQSFLGETTPAALPSAAPCAPAAAHEPSLVLTRPIRSDHGCGGWVTQEPLAKPRPSATQCHVLPSPPGVCHFVNLPEMEHGEQIAWGSCCSLLSPAQQCTGDDQRLPEARVYEFTKHSVPALQREAGWWPPFHSPDHVLGHFWKRWACLCFCGHTLVHQGTGIKGGKGPSPSVAAAEGERSRTTDTASCQRQLSPGVCWEACGSLSIFSLVFLSFLGAFKSS